MMARSEYHKYLYEVTQSPSDGFEGRVGPPGAQNATAAGYVVVPHARSAEEAERIAKAWIDGDRGKRGA
jgi:hypothetical protein